MFHGILKYISINKRGVMNKNRMLKIVNPALAFFFACQALSGIFHNLIPYEAFKPFHGVCGLVLVVLAIIHLFLNWTWVKSVFLKKTGR
jgi:hypothetical protein